MLLSGMKVVKSAKYSTMTGFMYAGVGDREGALVGVELEGDEVGDVTKVGFIVGLADGLAVGKAVGLAVEFAVGCAVGIDVGGALGVME